MIDGARQKNTDNKILTVSPSPHFHHPFVTTRNLMLVVILAMLPLVFWACYIFGTRTITITVVAVVTCVLCEFLYEIIMKQPITTGDLSAVVTGILLALNVPITIPLWMVAIGAVFAIVVVKMLFGGIGKNFVNPALAARVFLMLSWPAYMAPNGNIDRKFGIFDFNINLEKLDIIASPTPLAPVKEGVISTETLSFFDMLLGKHGGVIGEVSALLIIVGFLIMLFTKVITWHIPVSYVGTVALLTYWLPRGGADRLDFMLYNILAGGLLLGAVFMATDYTTSPVTKGGRVIYGIGCGLITVFIRYVGSYPEGVSFAILIMNLFVFYIDKYSKPITFGGGNKGMSEQKGVKYFLKLGLILLVICAVTATALSIVYSLTKDKIEEGKLTAEKEAILNKDTGIFPNADDIKTLKLSNYDISGAKEGTTIHDIYEVKSKGKIVGYCIKVSSIGYGGPINIMVGTTLDGKIVGVRITSMQETQGYGAKAQDKDYLAKYEGKTLSEVYGVDKVASSTKTTVALKDGIAGALSIKGLYGGGAGE